MASCKDENEAREVYEKLAMVEHVIEGINPRWMVSALQVLLITIDELRSGITYGLTSQAELDKVRGKKEGE